MAETIKVRIWNPVMGVPITYLGKHDPKQFELVGTIRPIVGGVPKYQRILIRRTPYAVVKAMLDYYLPDALTHLEPIDTTHIHYPKGNQNAQPQP
jgi:L-cystine uptake protein TcyP (sodium:dicarboxylate symporter family)